MDRLVEARGWEVKDETLMALICLVCMCACPGTSGYVWDNKAEGLKINPTP